MSSCTGATGQTGTVYTYAQLQGLWINAGGSKSLAPLAAAIAMAESGGCSAAVNPTDNNGTQTSWGLWQISNGTHSQPVPGILSPATNAQQAVAKYTAAGGFSPWGTYDSGAYKAYYSGSTTPDTNVPSAPGSQAAPGADDPSTCLIGGGEGGILGVGAANFCILSKSGARALIGGMLVGGGFLVMGLGVALIAAFAIKQSGPAQTVINMTPLGRTAAAATPLPPKPKASPKPKAPGPNSPAQGRHAKTGKNAPPKGKHAKAS
jgi:Lysozyme like domain